MNALETVNLREFFSVCSQVILHSGNVIKDLHYSGKLNARTKNEAEPFTDADVKVQTIIIKSLQTFWPNLKIIGEEEEVFSSKIDIDFQALKTDFLPQDIFTGLSPIDFNIKDAIVWVDPLDGTVDFLKGELDCVTTLIGVSLNARATLGVVGRYFRKEVQNGETNYAFDPTCYFAHTDYKKVFSIKYNVSNEPFEFKPFPKDKDTEFTVLTSKNHLTPEMIKWINETLKADKIISIGGAGNKMLCVAEGVGHCYVNPSRGTKKWDTCAGEALIRALGGKVTDSSGQELEHLEPKSTWMNEKGIVAYLTPDERYSLMK